MGHEMKYIMYMPRANKHTVDDPTTFLQHSFQNPNISSFASPRLYNHHSISPGLLWRHTPFQSSLRQFSTSARLASSSSSAQKALTAKSLTHLTKTSEIHIVPISDKTITTRHATAVAYVSFQSADVLPAVRSAGLRKGDVLSVARIAGIQAAKRTSDIVPLCHPGVQLEGVRCWVEAVDPVGTSNAKQLEEKGSKRSQECITIKEKEEESERQEELLDTKLREYLEAPLGQHGGIRLAAVVSCTGKTGVEMEALCAVSGAGLCVLDMVKGMDRGATLEGIQNVRKSGGRSGVWWKEGWETD